MSEFEVKIVGDTAVEAKLANFDSKLQATLLRAITRLGMDLKTLVVDVNLAGAVLKRQTGNLARAQNLKVTETSDPDTITASVGFNKATAIYGVFHEFGVPHSWEIRPKKGKALKIPLGANAGIDFAVSKAEYAQGFIFRSKVVHPPLPVRSFLRSALKTMAPQVRPAIEAAIAEANAS